ncbi:MAG: hypothetical protein ABIJ23_00110 [Candidatus Magasanikbacteria bacterium]
MSVKKEGENKKIKKAAVEKKSKKNLVKKSSKKTITKKKAANKKEIKKAVERLPGLIVEQIKFEQQIKNGNPEYTPQIKDVEEIKELKPIKNGWQNYYDGRDRKWLVWLGVIIFSIVIFIIWGWNLNTEIQDIFSLKDSKNLNIIQDVREDFQSIIDETETEEKLKETKEVITTTTEEADNSKEKLRQHITNLISTISSSTISTTTDINTTSTTTNEIIDSTEETKEKNTIKQSDDTKIIPIL